MTRVVIIGASCAGHNLAVSLREKNRDCSIVLITEEAYPCYDRRRLGDFLAGSMSESEIFISSDAFYSENNIDFIKGQRVAAVNTVKKTVSFKARDSLGYDFLVVASGRKIVPQEVSGIKKSGVMILYSLDDFKQLSDCLMTDTVSIVGDDHIALGLAKIISSKNKVEVKLISRKLFDNIAMPDGVEVINAELAEIIGEGGVQAIKLKNGKVIGTSKVIFRQELKGNTDFLKNTPLETDADLLLVNNNMRTNIETIFACGAVCMPKEGADQPGGWDKITSESIVLSETLSRIIKEQPCQMS